MDRKERIKKLETELRILGNIGYVQANKGSAFHARHNKFVLRYNEIAKELEALKAEELEESSLSGKIKKYFRRWTK